MLPATPRIASAQEAAAIIIRGTVVDAAGQPVNGGVVTLRSQGSGNAIETRTSAVGSFAFPAQPAGNYRVSAASAGLQSEPALVDRSSPNQAQPLRLQLHAAAPPTGQAMEFADQPNFTVAGVTDWTAVGGHGSDATLRTSEDLARQTAALQAQSTPHSGAALAGNRVEAATTHRKAAEGEEHAGDPLAAVHEYEQAARLDPSEENYFAWGSELLLHRAVWQAVEVFRTGNKLHPGSARMLTGLGSALFAGDLFDQAAASLCSASDLQPADPAPYRFLGRVAIAAPAPLPCAESTLARFAQAQPQDATALYLYAMAVWKTQEHAPQPDVDHVRALLEQAVALDPRCAEAWLQLGILATNQGNTTAAIRNFRKAIEADPQLGEAHYRLGVAYDRSGEAGKARQEFALHDEIERSQAAAVERQRKEIKQFLVVLEGQPAPASAH